MVREGEGEGEEEGEGEGELIKVVCEKVIKAVTLYHISNFCALSLNHSPLFQHDLVVNCSYLGLLYFKKENNQDYYRNAPDPFWCPV